MTDWQKWRRCSTCLMDTGLPCVARSGRVVDGQPDNVVTKLDKPHKVRQPRVIGIDGMPGYVVGLCDHRVARSEWRAGFRVCERCG